MGKGELWSDQEVVELGFSIYEDDRQLLWRMGPGLDTVLSNFLTPPAFRDNTRFRVITDSRGFRITPQASPEPAPLRVACLGDSHTFGWGLPGKEAFPSVLEDELKSAGLEVAVLNRGQPGFSTAQGLVLLEEVLERDKPQAVVLAFGFNDSRRADIPDQDLMAGRVTLGGRLRWSAGRLQVVRLAQSILPPRAAPPSNVSAGPRVSTAAFMTNLAAMARACQDRSVPVVFLSLFTGPALEGDTAIVAADWSAPHVKGSLLAKTCALRLRDRSDPEAAQAASRALARFSPDFLNENPRYWIRVDAAHYSGFVHQAVARVLARELAPRLKEPAGR
jgi:lysophospholipase L1-like esterase